jgi:hypothetical protein
MKDRKKAQDVFNETDFLFQSKTTDFDKAIPGIEDILVDVTETGKGVYYSVYPSRYTKNNISEFINCSNRLCYNGGFRIADIIREMVYQKATNKEGSVGCQGKEGSPQGKRTYGSCYNKFKYKIQIKYKQQIEKSSTEDNTEEDTKQ